MKCGLSILTLLLFSIAASDAQVSIDKLNTAYIQTFNSLDSVKGDTSAVMPTGWYFAKPNSSSKTYKVDSGSSTSGNVYSYGFNKKGDHALGTLGLNTLQPIIGAAITNNTGKTITSVYFKFVVEQWRYGGSATSRHDSMRFEISYLASSISDPSGFWVRQSSLDLYSPVGYTNGGSGTALDGNLAANQDTISATITGISIPNGFTVWLRWTDVNISGNDDALAIDNFEIIANPVPTPVVSFANTYSTIREDGDSAEVVLNIKNPNATATSATVAVNKSSSASAGSDYVYPGGTYTFPASSSTPISFWIKIVNDKVPEGVENIILNLKNPTNGAVLGDSVEVITILDDDSADRNYKIRDVRRLDTNNL